MPRHSPSKIAAALDYLQRLKSQAADFGGGVVDTLADRAQDVGKLAYEAFTSDPNIGRMTTAEFSQAAADRPSTPRLDATAQGVGAMGKALVTQPVQTAKAVVVDPVVEAFESPRAMGQFAGEFVNPLRIAAALRKTAPIAELDVYHGTPHRFEPTEANPLGEFDASKVGTGEGAQAYGHGIYLAEAPDVAKGYAANVKDMGSVKAINAEMSVLANIMHTDEVPGSYRKYKTDAGREAAKRYDELMAQRQKVVDSPGSLYKADLPDEMIDRMLDWDKPFSEQPEGVKKLLAQRGPLDDPRTFGWKNPEKVTGGDIYNILSRGSQAKPGMGAVAVSEALRQAGVPGVRYLDAGSRGGSGTGTRNFVVFPGEEKKVKILKRD
jgi:hypothetical protein